jgi:hypothetical protein
MYRSLRYFTRPSLIAADLERAAAGIPDRHNHPPFHSLPRGQRFVIVISYPFLQGFGDGIPQVLCVVQWAEGGLQWTTVVTLVRFRGLPKMAVDNPHLYKMA